MSLLRMQGCLQKPHCKLLPCRYASPVCELITIPTFDIASMGMTNTVMLFLKLAILHFMLQEPNATQTNNDEKCEDGRSPECGVTAEDYA